MTDSVADTARMAEEIRQLKGIIAGTVDPIFAGSLREQIRAELIKVLSYELRKSQSESEMWQAHNKDLVDTAQAATQQLGHALLHTRQLLIAVWEHWKIDTPKESEVYTALQKRMEETLSAEVQRLPEDPTPIA